MYLFCFPGEREPSRCIGKWLSGQVASTCYKEVAMLFQGLTVFPNNVVQTQVQFIKCQRLLCVGCCFSCWIIVCFLKHNTWRCLSKKVLKEKQSWRMGKQFVVTLEWSPKDNLLEDAQEKLDRKKIRTLADEQQEFKKNHQDRRDLPILTEGKTKSK